LALPIAFSYTFDSSSCCPNKFAGSMRFFVAPGAVKLVLFSSTGFAVVSYGTDSSFFLKSNPVAGAAVDFAPDMVVVPVVVAEVEGVTVVVGVFVLVTELIYGAKVDFGS